MHRMHPLIIFALLAASAHAFSSSSKVLFREHVARSSNGRFSNLAAHHDSNADDRIDKEVSSRRDVIKNTVASTLFLPLISQALPVYANDEASTSYFTEEKPNLDCLLNLPPITPGCVRIYLCRHGQTENNRLRLVQGARVNPSINGTGRKQAIRLGEALSRLKQSRVENLEFPKLGLHSTLLRAQETAEAASLMIGRGTYDEDANYDYVRKYFDTPTLPFMEVERDTLKLMSEPSLAEIDFGSIDGKDVKEAKSEMMRTFGKWAIGQIDASNGGGEDGRSVLQRVAKALFVLRQYANDTTGSVVAVTHSAYLRVLLCLIQGLPFLAAKTIEQKNCCINVIDVSMKEVVTITNKSSVFGGLLSQSPADFRLQIPKAYVIRQNEISHLEGLL